MKTPHLFLLLCLLHGISGSANAQSGAMPPWVVPVLRLVSTTHVEPTTGVVLSADGLVLVPADFAAPGDEIVVLDGGTDIIRNGRPARLERGFPEFGLEVLRVEGLDRTGAPVAPGALDDGSSVTLRAFPPAEQIAEGAPPVSIVTAINVFPENETPTLAAGTALPDVTGAFLDSCGNLAGLSLADGVQSLATAAATQYLWAGALRSVLAELQLPVTGRPCRAMAAAGEPPPPVAEEPARPQGDEQPPTTEPEASANEQSVTEQAADEQSTIAGGETELPVEMLPPFEEEGGADEAIPVAPPEPARLWPWLAGALVLLTGGLIVHRLRQGSPQQTPKPGQGSAADRGPTHPTAGGEQQAEWLAPGPVSRLVLRGSLADGRPIEAATEISANAINVEIGRGNADLVIDSFAVSRRHARLNGNRDALTLTDLGSSNGSSINGVPCLEDEIMYLAPGDTVTLGDARFTVTIEDAPVGGEDA